MSTIKLWHNPRCSKSRGAKELLEQRGVEIEVIKYLDEELTTKEIEDLLEMLGIKPRELMRTKEDIYKELNLKDELDDTKLIEAMVAHPKLIERPICIKDGVATIGRPIENIIKLLEN